MTDPTSKFSKDNKIHHWMSFSLGKFDEGGVSRGATALMGHYLVIFVQRIREHLFCTACSKLYVIDLRDNSIQEERVPVKKFQDYEDFSFNKYGENQIIMLCDQNFLWITIDSFTRNTFISRENSFLKKLSKLGLRRRNMNSVQSYSSHLIQKSTKIICIFSVELLLQARNSGAMISVQKKSS